MATVKQNLQLENKDKVLDAFICQVVLVSVWWIKVCIVLPYKNTIFETVSVMVTVTTKHI